MPRRTASTPRSRRGPRAAAVPLVAESRAMRRLLEQLAQVAGTRAPLLIEGEYGSGRHRVALAIHRTGPRASGPFVRVHVGALPGDGADEALFGGAGGASLHASAAGGTLYLEDVEGLPAPAQARLILALHDRGDVRVIASTTTDLAAEVARGAFRADLRDRLAVVRVHVPALRERREDLEPLALQLLAERPERGAPRAITPGALERLAAHDWPGNVRELRDVLATMAAHRKGRGPLTVSDLPEHWRSAPPAGLAITVGMTVSEAERRLIAATLEHTGADKRRAAALLGIGLRTLYRKIRAYRLG